MQRHGFTPLFQTLGIAALALSLAACGGGGGGGGSDNEPAAPDTGNGDATAPQDTGSVSAAFAANGSATPGYFLVGVGSQVLGQLTTFTQSASGAMTALNDSNLSGSPNATLDISGDAFQAQGRWARGTVSNSSGSTVLTGNNAAYHYLAYNRLATFPASGTFTCDAGRFTAPTYIGGTAVQPAAYSGTATASAPTLSFSSAGAAITASYSVQAGGATASGSIGTTVPGPTSTAISGQYLGGNAGSVAAIGDGGNGTYLIAVTYKASLSNGANYQGVANFRCGS